MTVAQPAPGTARADYPKFEVKSAKFPHLWKALHYTYLAHTKSPISGEPALYPKCTSEEAGWGNYRLRKLSASELQLWANGQTDLKAKLDAKFKLQDEREIVAEFASRCK